MIIHCSHPGCHDFENISSASIPNNGQIFSEGEINLDLGPTPPAGFPYQFEDVVTAIEEALPTWRAEVDVGEGVKRLLVFCPRHHDLMGRVNEIVERCKKTLENAIPIPYVGMTGFKSLDEVAPVVRFLREEKPFDKLGYVAMFGFTSSNKRLTDIQSEGKTSPKLTHLFELCDAIPFPHIPMIHYFTDKPENLLTEMQAVFTHQTNGVELGTVCTAAQINQEWPAKDHIDGIGRLATFFKRVIQIPAAALNGDADQIAFKAQEYKTEYFLIDPSGGTGKDFDLARCRVLLPKLEQTLPRTTIGVAGGIGPNNVATRYLQISEIASRPFSIDAQGKLRTNDVFDPDKAIEYLRNAAMAIRNSKFGKSIN